MSQLLHTKHFTQEQAKRILTGMIHLVEEVVELKKKLDKQGYDIYRHEYFGGRGPNGDRVFPREMERLIEIVSQLDSKGIQMKDLDQGLIDFPHIRSNGEEVYLCWKIGENNIEFWHTISDGFAGRKPISKL
jgi:hypothetical protein